MRMLVLAAVMVIATGASEPSAAPLVSQLDMPSYQKPSQQWRSVEDAEVENCRDRIRQVREESGQPPLENETADPDDPVMIWAVDRREDGCAVMVVKGDPEDIRPLPKAPRGPLFRRIPAD